jgi:hypothetical protein
MDLKRLVKRLERLEKRDDGRGEELEATEEELLFLATLHHEVRKDPPGPPSQAPITDEEYAAVAAVLAKDKSPLGRRTFAAVEAVLAATSPERRGG